MFLKLFLFFIRQYSEEKIKWRKRNWATQSAMVQYTDNHLALTHGTIFVPIFHPFLWYFLTILCTITVSTVIMVKFLPR